MSNLSTKHFIGLKDAKQSDIKLIIDTALTFREVLESHNFPYKLISGSIETRIKSSVKVIDKLF